MTNVLVVAAHPDDEVIGCGGTLLKHKQAADNIHILTLTDGVSARLNPTDGDVRNKALENVAKSLNASYQSFDFRDNRLDSHDLLDIVQKIEQVVSSFQPEVVYVHHQGDLNIDHAIACKAALTACRPQPDFCVRQILSFEVNSSTEWSHPNIHPFMPNHYEDVTDFIIEKQKLLKHYEEEMRAVPHSRSIEAIINRNRLRGSEVGLIAAEAFQIIRQISR